jgi:hypothetical protein
MGKVKCAEQQALLSCGIIMSVCPKCSLAGNNFCVLHNYLVRINTIHSLPVVTVRKP